jgi:hypothetical protein
MVNVITYIYQDFADERSSTHEFRRSVKHFGYGLANVSKKTRHVGNEAVLLQVADAFKEATGPTMYADGADTFFVQPIVLPTDHMVYSTEKAIWPPTDAMKRAWESEPKETPWAYLNGGAYGGPAELVSEFLQRYVLPKLKLIIDDGHAQAIQALAYFQASRDGFPIKLDQKCEYFQSISFAGPDDFELIGTTITNRITGTTPSLFHGNGREPMGWVYSTMPKV